MAREPKRRFWRIARRAFRWFRITIWLLLLAVLICAVWLNRVGLPDFLKTRLVAELRARGMEFQFSRMRLHWYRGLIAENVRIGGMETNAPQFAATEADFIVNGRALMKRQFQLSGVSLRGGRMTVPVWGTNEAPREVAVQKISGELRFFPPDQWELVGFRAESFGVKFLLDGAVTNASDIRKLKLARTRPKEKTPRAFWYNFITKLEQSQFDTPSEIIGIISGDAREPSSFRVSLNVKSPRVVSPWGRGQGVSASAQVAPTTNGTFVADVKLQATDARTPWGNARSLNLEAHVAPSFTRWTPTNAHLSLALKQARTAWANAGNVTLVADFTPSPADETASLAHYTLRAQQVDSKWAKALQLEVVSDAVLTSSNLWPSSARTKVLFAGARGTSLDAASGAVEATLELPPLESLEFANTNLSWWTRLDRVRAGLNVKANGVRTSRAEVKQIAFNADWRAPSLVLTGVRGEVFGGTLEGRASLDTETRRLTTVLRTTIDPHNAAPLLPTNAQRWLDRFAWSNAPLLAASAAVTLPAWTNGAKAFAEAPWEREVLPTFTTSGDFSVGPGSWRGVSVSAAQSSFIFTNLTWRLPDMALTRPEGRAVASLESDVRSREFTFDMRSSVFPNALRPLFTHAERELVDSFVFTNPPALRLQLGGRWNEPDSVTARAEVSATNLSFRSLPVLRAETLITFTNKLLAFVSPVVQRSEGTGRADSVVVDMRNELVRINNATGSLDPWAVTHAVGPETEEAMRPYRFEHAPVGRVNGVVSTRGVEGSDLRFELAGGPFEWSVFRFQQITGHVHWLGKSVTLSNVHGSLHGGKLEGSARFDFAKDTRVAFRTLFNDINMHSLLTDLGSKSNRVEGTLNGLLVITNGTAEDFNSWFGYGNAAVNEGLLWEFPIFGLFSPMLNAVKEGAGNNKAREAVATFNITNGVMYSSDLVVHASSNMRLRGEGTVAFDGRVNGRMRAQAFRDTPGIGTIMATVLWPVTTLFEYKVTGTLAEPKAEPLYIPSIITHPFRTLRKLGAEDEKK